MFRGEQLLLWENLFYGIDESSVVDEDIFAYTVDWHTAICDSKVLENGSWLHEWLFADLIWDLSDIEEISSLLRVGSELVVPGNYWWTLSYAAHAEVAGREPKLVRSTMFLF